MHGSDDIDGIVFLFKTLYDMWKIFLLKLMNKEGFFFLLIFYVDIGAVFCMIQAWNRRYIMDVYYMPFPPNPMISDAGVFHAHL